MPRMTSEFLSTLIYANSESCPFPPPLHSLLLQAETHFRKAEKLLSLGAGTGTSSSSPSPGSGATAVAAIIRTGIERRRLQALTAAGVHPLGCDARRHQTLSAQLSGTQLQA